VLGSEDRASSTDLRGEAQKLGGGLFTTKGTKKHEVEKKRAEKDSCIIRSGMRDNGNDRNHSSLRAIIPEDPVSARCFLLGKCLEDLFPIRAFEGSEFVRV